MEKMEPGTVGAKPSFSRLSPPSPTLAASIMGGAAPTWLEVHWLGASLSLLFTCNGERAHCIDVARQPTTGKECMG